MKVEVTFTEAVLATLPNDEDLHRNYIASKSADAEKVKQELESLSVEARMSKALSVFPRADGEAPAMWDYQVKGFFKETL